MTDDEFYNNKLKLKDVNGILYAIQDDQERIVNVPIGQELPNWIAQTESAIVHMQKQLTRIAERLITFEDQVNYVKRFQEEYKPISIDNLIKRVDKLTGEADGKAERLKWETDRANEAIKVLQTFNEKMIEFEEYKTKISNMCLYLQQYVHKYLKDMEKYTQDNFVKKAHADHDE